MGANLINRNVSLAAYINSHFLVHKVNFKSLLLLVPRPSMAFDINSQYVKTDNSMQVVQEQSNFFNNLSDWGQEKIFDSKEGEKKSTFALQYNCWKLYRDWKLNASVDCLMICCRKLSVMGNMVWKDITHFSWWI